MIYMDETKVRFICNTCNTCGLLLCIIVIYLFYCESRCDGKTEKFFETTPTDYQENDYSIDTDRLWSGMKHLDKFK